MRKTTPARLGYRMPAEWEPQKAVWLTWPHNALTWPDGMLARVQFSYISIIRELHTGQQIKLLVKSADEALRVRGILHAADVSLNQVQFVEIAAEDSWIRDYGPIFVVNKDSRQLGMVKWIFNAWGNKYDDLI